MEEPKTLTRKVIHGWVCSYHRGSGWYALFSAPIIGINEAAQSYWLRQAELGGIGEPMTFNNTGAQHG